jgi:hypothetical protein
LIHSALAVEQHPVLVDYSSLFLLYKDVLLVVDVLFFGSCVYLNVCMYLLLILFFSGHSRGMCPSFPHLKQFSLNFQEMSPPLVCANIAPAHVAEW